MDVLVYICAFVGVSSLITSVLLAREIVDRVSARSWPAHVGAVREAAMTSEASKSGMHYFVKVKFDYVVGRAREGRCVIPSRWGTSDLAVARRLLSQFEAGRSVPVYVHPRSPSRAVLVPGVLFRDWLIGGLFLAIGLAFSVGAVALWKQRPNQSLEPTRVLGTSAAEPPRVPSTRVAHL